MKDSKYDREYAERMSYKNGEIVKFASKEPVKNVFCLTCGHTWGYNVRVSLITEEALEEEKAARCTEEKYQEMEMLRRERYEEKKNRHTWTDRKRRKAEVNDDRGDSVVDKRSDKVEILYFDISVMKSISEV